MLLKQLIDQSINVETLDELMLSYTMEQALYAANALLRLASARAVESDLVAVCWTRSKPFLNGKTWRDEYIDFVSKTELLRDFEPIAAYDEISLTDDWYQVHNAVSYQDLTYLDAVVLGMHRNPVQPISWSHRNLSQVLGAEVPDCVTTGKFDNVGKLFLYHYLEKSVRSGCGYKNPYLPSDREMTGSEMKQVIKDIYIFNKISIYQEMRKIHRELCQKRK